MRVHTKALASVIAIATLIASGLAGANAAHAAPGDVSEIGLAAGATPRDVARGPDGSMWVTGGDSKTIAKITMAGAVTAYALPIPANVGNPWGIAAGPDGNMWFTLRQGGKLGRITMQGAVSIIDLPDATMRPQDIAAGADGNMWFTELGGRIGRVTMAGAVTMFTVPWANSQPHSIVQGPTGSSRMYFTDAGADRVAFVFLDGTSFGSVNLTAASNPTGIANVNGDIWFAMSARNQLGKLVADTTVLEMSVPGAPSGLTNGAGNTLWVSLSARNSVAKYSAQGAPLGEYNLTSPNSGPSALSEGPDTNIWVAQTTAGKVARVLSGQVPVSTAPPAITPNSGVRPGVTLTTSDGSWTNAPSSFVYQWQACTNASDVNSCVSIPGATTKTFVPAAANNNQFLRVSVQGVNASGSGSAAFSTLVAVGTAAPPRPTPGPVPTPVAGGATVNLADGVTMTLQSPSQGRIGGRATFVAAVNTANIKGKVRISIVDAAGRERQVIAKNRWLKSADANSSQARKAKRLSRSLAPGTYTVRAVFTPTPAFRDNYPIATLSQAITIRR